MATRRFNVSSRIALLLGESYRTIEQALKELVDNAWDADATQIAITLPEGPEAAPHIIIADNGEGMTPDQIETDYLRIARDRRKERGPRTAPGRKVKGRKGMGKFAGIVVAGRMKLETSRGGRRSSLTIDRGQLESGPQDIEKVDVPVTTVGCGTDEHGTTITLSELFARINYPAPAALRHALAPEYGRQSEMKVFVNDDLLTHLQIDGHKDPKMLPVPGFGEVHADFVIADKKLLRSMRGIQIKVTGKSVGPPTLFGLEDDERVPTKLLEFVTGDLLADCLEDAATTCGWTDLLESDKSVQAVFAAAREHLRSELFRVFDREMKAAEARYLKKYKHRLDDLPEQKRDRAKEEIRRILLRHFREDDRIDEAIELLLRSLEYDDYWMIAKKVLEAKSSDIAALADALKELNLADIALVAKQLRARLVVLDKLRDLIANDETTEKAVHVAIENALWVFGYEFALISSERRLATIIQRMFDGVDDSDEKNRRPDLLLLNRYMGRYLLIEFKRPRLPLDWDHKTQAERYRAKLEAHANPLDIIVLGGRRRPEMQPLQDGGRIREPLNSACGGCRQ
jgi:hypothetical protein